MTMQTKKKLNKADYMFGSKNDEHDLVKMPGQIDGIMFKIRELHDCTVHLYDHMSQVSLFATRILLSFNCFRLPLISAATPSFSLVPSSNLFSSEIVQTAS